METKCATNACEREFSYGEKLVGLTPNPEVDAAVTAVNRVFARAIDEVNALRRRAIDPEAVRMYSVAITETQTAQMWAVKAITWKS